MGSGIGGPESPPLAFVQVTRSLGLHEELACVEAMVSSNLGYRCAQRRNTDNKESQITDAQRQLTRWIRKQGFRLIDPPAHPNYHPNHH